MVDAPPSSYYHDFMALFLLLLLCGGGEGDHVQLRGGKKVEGAIISYDRFVEVEQAGGKIVRIPRADIERIEIVSVPLRSPEIVPFPADLLEKSEHDFVSYGQTLVALPRPPGRKAVAIDFTTGRKIWEREFLHRVGDPVFAGRTLYFIERERFVDDTKKYKVGESTFSRDVHKLTVSAVDLSSGETVWSHVFDNNDRKDLLWEFTSAPPILDVLPGRALIRTIKIAWPMDRSGNVAKGQPRTFVTLYMYDTDRKNLLHAADSVDAKDASSRWYFTEDLAIYGTYPGQSRWQIAALNPMNGKEKWKSEEFSGKLLDVTGDNAYVIDSTHLTAWSTRTGKKLEKWAVEHTAGEIADIDYNYVYYYRTRKEPRAILGYDVKKAEEAFRILVPEQDAFKHLLLAGHRLLFADREGSIYAFDTLARKDLWKWKGEGKGPVRDPRVAGGGLSFIKDGKLYYIGLADGQKLWEVKGTYKSIHPLGNSGLLCHFLMGGADMIRERRGPEGAVFFTPSGAPLRFVTGEEAWSIPAFGPEKMHTLSSGGTLLTIDLKEKNVLGSVKAAEAGPVTLLAPVLHEGRLIVTVNNRARAYDADLKTVQYQFLNSIVRPDRPVHALSKELILTADPSGLIATDFATGAKAWSHKTVRSAVHLAVRDTTAYVVTGGDLEVVDLQKGAKVAALTVPPGTTWADADGGRVFAAVGPFEVGEAAPDKPFRSLFKSPQQDPKAVRGFRGSLAAAGGNAIFSHAAGEVACVEGKTGTVLWRFAAPQRTSSLLVHGGRVWFSAPGLGLFGLNAAGGGTEWKAEPADASLFTPFVRGDKAAFWSSEGWLIETK